MYVQQTELVLREGRVGELERSIEESDHEITYEVII